MKETLFMNYRAVPCIDRDAFILLIHANLMFYLGGRFVIPARLVCHSSLSGLRLIENPSDSFGIVKKDPG